ncbi:MAG: TonB family protein [Pyrinomonadaceae bacterium]|nr:TonB family protein [Acidobacteriota bacterium]
MPLNVSKFCTSVLLVLVSFFVIIKAQVAPASQLVSTAKSPTSAEVMRDRISKAKAYIAVRNYNAAIYELENIRRETSDTSVQNVTNVLLMNSYLEQGDYKRAQDFLSETFDAQKANKPNSSAYYSTIAGQVIKGARNQIERYRALGIMVSDRNLPLEAVNDIERMRETLELVVTQTKEIGKDKQKSDGAMALLEEATNSRSALARDDYDARRWRDEITDSRERLANSRSVITNAVDGTTTAASMPQNTTAAKNPPVILNSPTTEATPVFEPVAMESKPQSSGIVPAAIEKPSLEQPEKTEPEPRKTFVVGNAPKQALEVPKPDVTPQTALAKDDFPLEVGSLIGYATKQAAPVYPPAARSMRSTGVVKVEVTVNEIGDVSQVQKTSGPTLLQTAAKDAVKKWKFKPFVRDGQPVKATGFVNFNFSL